MDQARIEVGTTHSVQGSLIVAWALVALLLDVACDAVRHHDFLVGYLFEIASTIVCAVLWLWLAGFIAVRGFRKRSWAAPAILLLGLAAVGAVQYMDGHRLGRLARFHILLRPQYQSIVAKLEAGQNPEVGPRFEVEKRPPLRVAFPRSGLLDNWCGVVYDPTGLVMKARNFKPDLSNFDDPALWEVRSLFGGDLRGCEPLGGHWYFCWFT